MPISRGPLISRGFASFCFIIIVIIIIVIVGIIARVIMCDVKFEFILGVRTYITIIILGSCERCKFLAVVLI